MSAPVQYEVDESKLLEVEELPNGSWKIKKINISIYKDPAAALRVINNYIKQKELEEKANEEFK